jgi:putative restriction endonuclease
VDTFLRLARESFRDLNGTDTFAEMTARIEAIRRRTGSALLARPRDYEVGCIMISQPVFFARDDWVADHADWHPRIQGGKAIDAARGDGQRILAECLERTARLRPEAEPLADELRRFGAPQTVQPRLGQGTFRIAVTSAYGACAVSGDHSLPALEAAHVRPYADGGEHALPNGLLLRADIHRLYDAGYVTVTPDYRFRVSRDLADDFHRRPRVRALRRPRHHRAARPARPARPRTARLACGRRVPRLSVTHHGRSSSLCGAVAVATLQGGMNGTFLNAAVGRKAASIS